MSAIFGIVRDGRIELEGIDQLPEGVRVRVEAIDVDEEGLVHERSWPESQIDIEKMIAEIRAIEPATMTSEELANLQSFRAKCKELGVESVRRRMEAF